MQFQQFKGLKFQNFPGGECPQTPQAYECFHVRL